MNEQQVAHMLPLHTIAGFTTTAHTSQLLADLALQNTTGAATQPMPLLACSAYLSPWPVLHLPSSPVQSPLPAGHLG